MIDSSTPPSASDPPEHHADWLEMTALKNPGQGVSLRDYVRDLSIAGTSDALLDEEEEKSPSIFKKVGIAFVAIWDERLLREALVLAEQTLKEARGLIPNGYKGDSDLLENARAISLLAGSIHDEMEKYPPQGRKGSNKVGQRTR